MDIHKPKPWLGWREFLKEYLIVVVGVLTALAGEQAVELLHWREIVHDARAALALDEQRNLEWAAEREGQSACIAHELRGAAAVLDRAAATGRLERVAALVGPANRPWTLNSYDAVVSGQALPHMGMQERAFFTIHDHWSQYLQRTRDIELHAWSVLRGVEGPARKTSDAEVANLRAALSEAIYEHGQMRRGSREFAYRIGETGLLSREEITKAWNVGVAHGRAEPPCVATTSGFNEMVLRQSETPMLPPPAWPPVPPNWPHQ